MSSWARDRGRERPRRTMSFQSPIYLLVLLAVPASVAIDLFADRRRRAGAARFASPALMPSVAPTGLRLVR